MHTTMNTTNNRPLTNMKQIFLGKNPSQTLFDALILAIAFMLSFKTLGAFFEFRLPENQFYYLIKMAVSTLIAFVACFFISWYGLRLSKTISNPKKVALFYALFFTLITVGLDLSERIYLTIPDDAMVRLLLLIAFYLLIVMYFLAALVIRKNFPEIKE